MSRFSGSVGRDANRVPATYGVASADGITVKPIEIDAQGNLLVNVAAGGGAGGTSSTFNAAFPGTGTAVGASDGVNMKPLLVDGSGNLKVSGSLSVGGFTDNSAFTAGTSQGSVQLGFYHSTIDTVTDGSAAATAITSKRAQHVNLRDNSGNELGISSAPLQVSIANTGANATAVKVDNSGVNQPVIGTKTNNNAAPGANNIGALVAIANAAAPTYTEGDQVLLSTDLSGNVRVTGSLSIGGTTDNSAYTAGTSTGTPAMGFYHSTIDTVTDGRAATVAITSKRALMVNLQNASGTEVGTSSTPLQVTLANTGANTNKLLVTADPITFASAQAVTQSGTWNIGTLTSITNPVAVTNAALTTADLDTGAGTDTRGVMGIQLAKSGGSVSLSVGQQTMANSLPVAIASDQSAVTVNNATAANLKVDLSGTAANATAIKVDGSAVTQPVSGTVSANATQTGTWNVGLSKTGTGYSVSSQTALTTTATVSAAAGKFGGAMFLNVNSAPAYIQVFDTTGAVTLGTTTPTFVIPIPANSTAANGVGFVLPLEVGIAMANGIKIAATTTATGSTTVSTGLCGFVYYN